MTPQPVTMAVVICTRDRPESLLRCIRSVVAQTSRPMELIVVDDGQLAVDCRDSIYSITRTAGIRFAYLQKDAPGLPASRNLAVQHASAEIVQFLDDDVVLEPDFCRHILRLYALDADRHLLATDATLIDSRISSAARAFTIMYGLAGWWALKPKNPYRVPLPPALRDRRWAVPTSIVSGACMSFRRSAVLEQAFDETLSGYALGEDRDMSLRLVRQGWILKSRGARAVHYHDPAGRPNHFQFGRMTVLNYVRIMRRIGRTDMGDKFVIAYSLAVIGAALAFCSLLKPRRYTSEFLGLLAGAGEMAAKKTFTHTGL